MSPFRDVPEPTVVEGIVSAAAVAAGASHGLALLEDGSVLAWGENSEGQLGDGSRDGRSLPLSVHRLNHVVAISAGGYHNLALLADGRVLAWGNNQHGGLGDGSTTRRRLKPVAVKGIEGKVVADWCLLLQVDSDDAAGIMWGDAGRVHFWIRQDDLKARNFDTLCAVPDREALGDHSVEGSSVHRLDNDQDQARVPTQGVHP